MDENKTNCRRDGTDIELRGVVAVVAGVGLTLVLLGAGAWLRLVTENKQYQRHMHATGAVERQSRLPPQPRLELLNPQNPAGETDAAQEKKSESKLKEPSSANEERFVRVPIDVAIRHVASELKSNPNTTKLKDSGVIGGDANSGRLLRGTRS